MSGDAVITGGEGDLARAIVSHFSAADWKIRAPGRRELDVRSPEQAAAFFKELSPDLLICNAGITCDLLLHRTSEPDWDEVLSVNLAGAMRCAKAASRSMLKQRRGHIVFVSSYSALHPPAGQVAYAAAKAGLIGLGKSLARELGPANIRVNVVLPGFLETRMTSAVSEVRRQVVQAEHTLGRFNTVEAVARFLRFLHENLPETSGQVFQLDSRI